MLGDCGGTCNVFCSLPRDAQSPSPTADFISELIDVHIYAILACLPLLVRHYGPNFVPPVAPQGFLSNTYSQCMGFSKGNNSLIVPADLDNVGAVCKTRSNEFIIRFLHVVSNVCT